MKPIRVIVKGSKLHAEQAAQYREIPATFIYEHRDKSILSVEDTYLPKVVKWFCEPAPKQQAEYPVGTCLLYQGMKPVWYSARR